MNLSASLFLELDLMGDGRLHHNIVSSSARTRPILSVRRSVSGDTPTLKPSLLNSVTVKHVPLMLMLSPRWASSRISEQFEMVSEVPPPPLALSSCWISVVTATWIR